MGTEVPGGLRTHSCVGFAACGDCADSKPQDRTHNARTILTVFILLTSFLDNRTCTPKKLTCTGGLVFLARVVGSQRRQHRDRFERGRPFADYFGNALVSGVKSGLQTMDSARRFERSMKSEYTVDSSDYTPNHPTADLAILQFPAFINLPLLFRPLELQLQCLYLGADCVSVQYSSLAGSRLLTVVLGPSFEPWEPSRPPDRCGFQFCRCHHSH